MFEKMCSGNEISSVKELKDLLENVPATLRERLRGEIRAVLIEFSQEQQECLAELAS